MQGLTFELTRDILGDLADVITAQAGYLTQLDAAIGDGDHGRNMQLGFESVRQELQGLQSGTPGIVLRAAGHILATTVGGAAGPLYSAAFISAALVAHSSERLGLADLARMAQAAAEAVARRGRCRLGDKTILDALAPAAQALAVAAAQQCSLATGLAAAAAAARRGMEATTPLIARCGLAMQYGAASAGHQDPGATSCYLLLDAAARSFARRCPPAPVDLIVAGPPRREAPLRIAHVP